MKKLLALSFVTLFFLAGCAGTIEDESTETAVTEDAPSVEDFEVRFEGSNFGNEASEEKICSIYNKETGEVISSVSKTGMFGECTISNTYGSKIFYQFPPDGLGGYYAYNPGFTSTYYVDVVTGEEGELGWGVIGYTEDKHYAFRHNGSYDEDSYVSLIDLGTMEETGYPVLSEEYGQFGSPFLHEDEQTLIYGAAIGDPSDEKMSVIVAKPGGENLEVISMSSDWYSITGIDGDTIDLTRGHGDEQVECTVNVDGSDLTCQE